MRLPIKAAAIGLAYPDSLMTPRPAREFRRARWTVADGEASAQTSAIALFQ